MSASEEASARRSGLTQEQLTRLERWKRGDFGHLSRPLTIGRYSRERPVPLSLNQQRLWFLDQLAPNSAAYNIPAAMRIEGALDVGVFERAVGEIVGRHEVLRTMYLSLNGVPIQIIQAPQGDFTLPLVDLAGCDPAEARARADEAVAAEARQPFNLERGPLVRFKLVRLNDREHLFSAVVHHIATDGWSWTNFFSELSELYAAFRAGRPSPLAALPIQYADFAFWQREWLEGETFKEHMSWWKKQLAGDLPILDLPSDYPRPPVQRFVGTVHDRPLSAELSQALRGMARREGVTVFMLLVAAFKALLFRHTGQRDVLIGSPMANRNRPELEQLIGFFVSPVILRTDLGGNPTFRELLARVRQTTLGALDHQDMPFEQLIDALNPSRDQSRAPLFQVMFILQSRQGKLIELGDAKITPLAVHSATTKFDVTLTMFETEAGFVESFEYSTDLFDDSTIAGMAAHLDNLLQAVVADPDRRLAELPLMGEAERRRMLVEWNDTRRPFDCRCAHGLFEEQAARTPGAVALDFEGRRQMTYGELNRRANQLAHHLRRLGVGPETLVGVLAERSLEMIVAVIGVLKAGGAYLPLEPTYPRERLEFMIEDAGAPIILTQRELLDLVPRTGARVVCLDSDWGEVAREGGDNPPPLAAPSNLAYVIYTSGSTGRPKGVLIEHRAIANFISSTRDIFEVTPHDRILQFASLCFDVSVFEIFTALLSGATLVLGGRETLLSPPALTQLMRERGVTITDLPPAMMTLLPSEELSTERIVFVGGEAFSGELVNRWALPGRRFYNGYGPTESTVTMTLKECTGSWTSSPPIGTPMPNHQVYILDRYLTPVPVGVPGEMYIGGAGLARGYLGRPGLTAETFIANPFGDAPGDRLYKTGDLARYLPNGDVDFLGRVDTQVKIRGFRVELGEVEAALGRHPDVRQAVVVAREDAPGAKRLVAYLLPADGGTPGVSDLRAFLEKQLPGYMVPAAFVVMDGLPMTSSGKVDLRALPAPPDDRPDLDQEFIAPRSPIEEELADRIFAKVLGLERLGVNDNFFELGGNSLQATQLMSLIRSAFSVEIPLRTIYSAPTVAGMAQAVSYALEHGTAQVLTAFAPVTYDLEADTVLDEDIRPEAPYEHTAAYDRAFVTGGTGYVGAFVIKELLDHTASDIYCLVRAKSDAEGLARLKKNLESYELWDEAQSHRVIAVAGDLSRPNLGLADDVYGDLSRSMEVIYHVGAQVNYVLTYPMLRPNNVVGVKEVLRFAARGRAKPLHSTSTQGVFGPHAGSEQAITEDSVPYRQAIPQIGYTQTKWVIEQLLQAGIARGLPVCIYRLGRVFGSSETGVGSPEDFMWRMVKGCIQLQLAPDMRWTQNLVPVDLVAKVMHYLSRRPESVGRVFHVFPPEANWLHQLIDWAINLGYPMRRVPYEEWLKTLKAEAEVSQDNAVYPILTTLFPTTSTMRPLDWQCPKTLEALKDAPFTYPAMDERLFRKYYAHLIRIGYLDAPPAREGEHEVH